MKYIQFISILLTFGSIYGQAGLTSYSADPPAKDTLEVPLTDIKKSDYVFYFRLLLSGQIVELYSRDNKTFDGKIVNSIKEYNQVKVDGEYQINATKLYTENVSIERSKATSLARQIIESGQVSIPTDSLIETGTRLFFHCESLKFEIMYGGRYLEQSFHCPWRQPDSLEFIDVILSNYDLLKRELNLDSIYQNFWSQLPKGRTYSRNGYEMAYLFTNKQLDALEKSKPQRDYLKSIKDTIDAYLSAELDKLQIKLKDLSCSGNYHLIFKENGKLWKMKVSGYYKPKLFDGLRWYLEDKREMRRCKKAIKQAVRAIDLSSFNLKYKVYRTLTFGIKGDIQLIDNTLY